MAPYFSSIINISATVITILGAFAMGYAVYLKQKQDELIREIRNILPKLDKNIFELSNFFNLTAIARPEGWDEDSIQGLFQEEIEELQAAVRDARSHESVGQTKPPQAQVSNEQKVIKKLATLQQKLLREFPQPPRVDSEEGQGVVALDFEKFFSSNFPDNINELENWIERFNKYHREATTIVIELNLVRFLKEEQETFQNPNLGKLVSNFKGLDTIAERSTETLTKIKSYRYYNLEEGWNRIPHKKGIIYGLLYMGY